MCAGSVVFVLITNELLLNVFLSLPPDFHHHPHIAPTVSPPHKPVTFHINVTSINITWSYIPTDPPTHFIVQILSSSYNDTKFHNLTNTLLSGTTHYVYTGLTYGVFYQFRVVAYRDGHLSDPSEPSPIFDNGLTGMAGLTRLSSFIVAMYFFFLPPPPPL